MSRKPESRLQLSIRHGLEAAFPGSRWYKIHGNEFQTSGIADHIGCVEGMFFALEVKKTASLSAAQIREIELINEAGGHACEVRSLQEAIRVVRAALRGTKTGRRLRITDDQVPRRSSVVRRARHR